MKNILLTLKMFCLGVIKRLLLFPKLVFLVKKTLHLFPVLESYVVSVLEKNLDPMPEFSYNGLALDKKAKIIYERLSSKIKTGEVV